MHQRVFAFALVFAAVPLTASAATITLSPRSLTLDVGHFSKITATTSGAAISLHSSTCFSVSGNSSPRDILKVISFAKENGKYSLQVRAQKAGSCEITFASGGDTAILKVKVEEE